MTGKMFSCYSMSVLACMMIFSGCGSRQAYDKKYYVLDAVRQAEPIRTDAESILEVRRFTIDSAFGGKGLVYRTGEYEYESDFYSEFLVSPAAMITDKTRNWLSGAGLFGTVLDVGSQVDADPRQGHEELARKRLVLRCRTVLVAYRVEDFLRIEAHGNLLTVWVTRRACR